MSLHRVVYVIVGALLATVASLCAAQPGWLGDVVKKLPFGSDRPPARSEAPPGGDSDASLLPAKPKAGVETELKADLLCERFMETDVWQKLMDYGGLEAQLRMKRLLSSDFQYSDLKPEDKAMLRYISYTTVWVPASIESGLGKLYVSALKKNREDETGDRSEARQLGRINDQLQSFKSRIDNFPGNVELLVDRSPQATGASSQAGGLIVLSADFLNRMDSKESVKHLVLAHELSHLYKRHTVKELQYQLVTSSAGFGLAKKLLSRYNPDASSNPLVMARNALEYASAAKELYDWVRGHQMKFNINQEFEADACAVQWMKRADLDPKSLVPALVELEAVQPSDETAYVRTHPTSGQRRDQLLIATGQKAAPAASKRPAGAASRPARSRTPGA